MTAAIDSNILLDILLDDPDFYALSRSLIEEYSGRGALIICPVVYAELLTQFVRTFGETAEPKLEQFLKDTGVSLVNFSRADLAAAASAWQKYTLRKQAVVCPECGHENNFRCASCRQPVAWRNHMITDFLVGGHAENNADVLLTRDRGYYKRYFRIELAPGRES